MVLYEISPCLVQILNKLVITAVSIAVRRFVVCTGKHTDTHLLVFSLVSAWGPGGGVREGSGARGVASSPVILHRLAPLAWLLSFFIQNGGQQPYSLAPSPTAPLVKPKRLTGDEATRGVLLRNYPYLFFLNFLSKHSCTGSTYIILRRSQLPKNGFCLFEQDRKIFD